MKNFFNVFKILLCIAFSANVFAISLGDTVNTNSIQAENTTTSIMAMSAQAADHDEYTINRASGATTVFVTKQGIAYGFKWSDAHPDFSTMLGNYKAEFDNAYASRANTYDHRRLIINTPNLTVQQFGLPNSKFQGSMYAKDLQP